MVELKASGWSIVLKKQGENNEELRILV